jgi:hypothetical protein
MSLSFVQCFNIALSTICSIISKSFTTEGKLCLIESNLDGKLSFILSNKGAQILESLRLDEK